jgi:signal transduction histidine kinase
MIIGPVLCAIGSGYGYWFSAQRRAVWRRDRHEREMAAAREQLATSERARARLSRDLHDSVGTALSLVALYGSLAHNKADDPSEARRLATTIRESARMGLNELRDVLQSLPQAPTRLQDLASSLGVMARRSAEPTGATLDVEVEHGGAVIVQGDLRTTLVRVFQEVVHNALHHGRAKCIRASLAACDDRVELTVSDDGDGFDPAARGAGTGISGMLARARELGGDVVVESAPGAGARVHLRLPLSRA